MHNQNIVRTLRIFKPLDTIRRVLNDHLYKNSLWLLLNSVVLTGFGFLFWTINARLFSPDQVGMASTLLSSVELLLAVSLLGLDYGLINYIPKFRSREKIINSCFSVAGIVAFVISVLFVMSVHSFLPKLEILKDHTFAVFFVIFTVFSVLYHLMHSVFIATRKSKNILLLGVIFSSLKLIFPFLLIALGAYGIFASWMVSLMITFIIGLFFVNFKLRFEIHRKIVGKIMRFSSANYLSNFFGRSPAIVLPLIIIHFLNPASTAYFYITWMMSAMIFMIPISVSKTLLAEGSISRNNLKDNIKKTVKFSLILLIPAVILTILLSKHLLLLFGAEYSANAFRLLQVFALSSIPLSINFVYVTVKNIQHRMGDVILVNFLSASGTIILSYFLIGYGLIMVGFSWLATQLLINVYVAIRTVQDVR